MAEWSDAALGALLTGKTWPQFHAEYPEYSYDAWEVKRRRVRKAQEVTDDDLEQVEAAQGYVGFDIVFWDLETTFSTQPRLLTAGFCDGFGNTKVFDLRKYPGEEWIDDRTLAVAIREELERYQIVVGWNSKRFDLPVLNGRLAFHRERPFVPRLHVDLMWYASGQFMRIGKRSLESVSKFFASPHSKTPLDPRTWDRADHGDMAAYDLICEHNEADVLVTRDVFAHLSPYIRNVHS